jgi:hypothetical protein
MENPEVQRPEKAILARLLNGKAVDLNSVHFVSARVVEVCPVHIALSASGEHMDLMSTCGQSCGKFAAEKLRAARYLYAVSLYDKQKAH